MKRQRQEDPPVRCLRNTRSKVVKMKHAKETFAQETFAASPILRGLSAVFKGGFLYCNDCRAAALTCRSWLSVWEDDKDKLPEHLLVRIKTMCNKSYIEREGLHRKFDDSGYPLAFKDIGLTQGVFSSYDFLRRVFDRIVALGRNKKRGWRAPSWSKDLQSVQIDYKATFVSIVFDAGISWIYSSLLLHDGRMELLTATSRKTTTLPKWELEWEIPWTGEDGPIKFWPREEQENGT